MKNIILTGGSSGVGASLVQYFRNLHYAVASLDKQAPQEAVEGAVYVQGDVRKATDIQHFYETVKEKTGVPDAIICNAGRSIHEQLAEGDPELWKEILDTNIMGTLRTIRAFIPEMLQRRRGDVVILSSVAATSPYPYGGVYSASKAALNAIAETLRLETQPYLRVTTIMPGVVDTSFFKNTVHGTQTVESIGWGAIRGEEIAAAVAFVLNQRPGTAINTIVIRPAGQPM